MAWAERIAEEVANATKKNDFVGVTITVELHPALRRSLEDNEVEEAEVDSD